MQQDEVMRELEPATAHEIPSIPKSAGSVSTQSNSPQAVPSPGSIHLFPSGDICIEPSLFSVSATEAPPQEAIPDLDDPFPFNDPQAEINFVLAYVRLHVSLSVNFAYGFRNPSIRNRFLQVT